jgi:hypothetical protein
VLVIGEGGSGGALGIAVGDRVLMQEFSVYSVIPPEGGAAILWRDSKRKVEAAEALKITAPDLVQLGLIDEIVKEPIGAAHLDHDAAAHLVDDAIVRHLAEVRAMTTAERLEARYAKFRAMGRLGQSFEDTKISGTTGSTGSTGTRNELSRANLKDSGTTGATGATGTRNELSRANLSPHESADRANEQETDASARVGGTAPLDETRGGLSSVERPGAKPPGPRI